MVSIYDAAFYAPTTRDVVPTSSRLIPLLFSRVPHASVLDVGCGAGAWCQAAVESGSGRVCGVDGPWAREHQLGDGWEFEPVDFEGAETQLPSGPWNLVLCIEVIEHLSDAAGRRMVKLLTLASNRIVWAAAVPGQGGVGHINERPAEYWIEQFHALGFEVSYRVRELLPMLGTVPTCYTRMMVFERRAAKPGLRIGVITAPRKIPRLGRTLESMLSQQQGLSREQIRVFSDSIKRPDETIDLGIGCEYRTPAEVQVIDRNRLYPYGCRDGTSNMLRSLRWSLESGDPYVCTTEDDIDLVPGWLDELVAAGERLNQRSKDWVLVPHFNEPASHFELFDSQARYETPGKVCCLRWTGKGTERSDYVHIGIGSQLCFMPRHTAEKVIDLFERARRGAFDNLRSIGPAYYALDVGLMKMSHLHRALDLCVSIPCLCQHSGNACAHSDKADLYDPINDQNVYFPGTKSAREAVETDVTPRPWQGVPDGRAAFFGRVRARRATISPCSPIPPDLSPPVFAEPSK